MRFFGKKEKEKDAEKQGKEYLAVPMDAPSIRQAGIGDSDKEKETQLLKSLLKTKKSFFGNPEKKLRKDISKSLDVKEEDAFSKENIRRYSRLPKVEKELSKGKKEAAPKEEAVLAKIPEIKIKDSKNSEAPRPKVADKKSPMADVSEPVGSEIDTRTKLIEQVLEEKDRLKEEEEKRKEKQKKNPLGVLKRPFLTLNGAISSFFSKISHYVFLFFSAVFSIPLTLGRAILSVLGKLLDGIYRRTGRLSPFGWKKKINDLVMYSGISKTQEEITGMTVVNGAILAIVFFAGSYFMMGLSLPVSSFAGLMGFALTWIMVYTFLNLMADKRTDEVEGALPDVLQIVSANISAGMTPYNALWVSARKEFGALAEEIKVAQKETLGGKAFSDALHDLGTRVRSNVLQRTVRLLIQGMKAGGELPNILQGIGADIRQMRLLQKEMAANTMSYVLFILFGMLLGAPLLFSVSIQFVDIMNKFQPETLEADALADAQSSPAIAGAGGGGFDMMSLGGGGCPKDFDGDGIADSWEKEKGLDSKNESDAASVNPETGNTYYEDYKEEAPELPPSCITPEYLTVFAMLALFSISFFGSILMGLIRSGKQSAGIKLMPLLIPATLGMFMLINMGMSAFFGSMFGA